MQKISLLILLVSLLYGCAKQPNCNGTDVKEILFGIIKEQMEKEIKEDYFEENYSYNDIWQYARDNGLDFDEVNNQVKSKIKSKRDRDAELNKLIDQKREEIEANYQKAIREIDEKIQAHVK